MLHKFTWLILIPRTIKLWLMQTQLFLTTLLFYFEVLEEVVTFLLLGISVSTSENYAFKQILLTFSLHFWGSCRRHISNRIIVLLIKLFPAKVLRTQAGKKLLGHLWVRNDRALLVFEKVRLSFMHFRKLTQLQIQISNWRLAKALNSF